MFHHEKPETLQPIISSVGCLMWTQHLI